MSADSNPLRTAAVEIVRTLQQAGHQAYLAGGCVRDELLGRQPKDYDVATDAPPGRVRELFPRSRYVGEAFGVVLVQIRSAPVEVATFRTEWGYEDGRRPTRVEFSDAQHDALRRDFTINGLFENPLAQQYQQRIIDYVGGRADLQARLIRAIGNPEERFGEDYLRMLRAVRIAANLDFTIELTTAAAIRHFAARLSQISRERIGQELANMLTGPQPAAAASLLQQLGLDAPALDEPHVDRPPRVLAQLGPEPAFPLALAAWMLDRHLPAGCDWPDTDYTLIQLAHHQVQPLVDRWRAALCLSNRESQGLWDLITLQPALQSWSTHNIAQRKRLLAQTHALDALALLRALAQSRNALGQVQPTLDDARELLKDEVAPPPLITGQDLITHGLKPGPRFKVLLDEAYDAQLAGQIADRDQALHWLRLQLA